MKNIYLSLLIIAMTTVSLQAQELIAVNHIAGGSEFFTRLDSAIANADHGDYITLPGTTLMDIGTLVVNKGVHIIGAGINPDSCQATGITYLTGNLKFVSGANSGSLQGVMLNGNLYFGTNAADQEVGNFFVSRCNLGTVYLSYNGADTNASAFLFRENIIRGHVYGGYSNAIFRNNIIEAQLNYFTGATFENNNFLWGNTATINDYVRFSTFSNNIFKYNCFVKYGWYSIYSLNNNYYNNLFNAAMQFQTDYYGCTATIYNGIGFVSGNLQNVADNLIYTSQSGNAYNIHHNYHLIAGSPGISAGTDGTDIGIYGGSEPFKDGSLPVNPHIRFKSVAGSTNPDGTLNVHFKVAAQDR